MTLPEQVAELSVHPKKTRCVCRLMRILVQSGFFAAQRVRQSEQEEGYVLTNASRLLLKDAMRAFLLVPNIRMESPCYLCP